jgi:XkdW protein
MNKAIAIQQIYPHAKPVENFVVVNDEGTQNIIQWNYSEPQPTEEDLQNAWNAYVASSPVEALSPIEQLQKDQADLMFQLVMKGVL